MDNKVVFLIFAGVYFSGHVRVGREIDNEADLDTMPAGYLNFVFHRFNAFNF